MNFSEYYLIEDCDKWYLNELNTPTDGAWRSRYVWHTTPTGQRNRIQVASMPANKQWKYAPLAVKLKLKKQGKDVNTDNPSIVKPSDETVRLFTLYYAGDRPESFDNFEEDKLVVATDDSNKAIEIEKLGHPIAVAKKVPLSAFKKYYDVDTKKWKNFPDDLEDENKFELIKFTDNDLYLVDFFGHKDEIIFSLSDPDIKENDDE
jgi:hypothetical protein